MSDFNLSQMVSEPTRQSNILDLFLITNHTLMNSFNVIPGLSDHNIVKSLVDTKPASANKAPRKVHLYRKADWVSLRAYMIELCNSCVLSYEGKSVEYLWFEFNEALNTGIQKFIPSKYAGQKKHLPWITHSIGREIRKGDRLYQRFKRSKDPKHRRPFPNSNRVPNRKSNWLNMTSTWRTSLDSMMKQVTNPFAGRSCLVF